MSSQQNTNMVAKSSKKKLVASIALELAGAVLLALVIAWCQPIQSANSFKANFPAKLELAQSLVSEVQENADAVTDRYDSLYQSKASTVALYAKTKNGFDYSKKKMNALFNELDVNALFAVDSQGAILAQCGATDGMQDHVLKAAKTALDNPNSGYQTLEEQVEGTAFRFYTATVDGSHAIVVAEDTMAIRETVESLSSVSDELDGISVGQTGFVLAIDSQGVVRYHGDSNLVGQQADQIGLTEAQLQDNYVGDFTMGGKSYLGQTCTCGDYTLISVLPYEEFGSFTFTYIIIGLLVYLMGASILVAYLYFAGTDRRRKSVVNPEAKQYKGKGNFLRSTDIARKALPVGAGCLIFVVFASLYLTTMVELSSVMVSNENHAQAASQEIETADSTASAIDNETASYVEEKAQLCAYILPRLESSQLTHSFMVDLRTALACDCVWYYDTDGNTIASDNSYWGYRLSDDPESFSYQFREVLLGRKSKVVVDSDVATNDWTTTKYVGLVVQDSNLRTIGMVEVGSDQTLVNKMKSSLSLESVLYGVQPGNNAFAFAVSQEDGKFTYYPDSNLVGELASDYGISEDNQEAGFSDYLNINGEAYLCSSTAIDGNYVYVATPASAVIRLAMPTAVITMLFSLLWFIVLILFMCLRTKKSATQLQAEHEEMARSGEVADVVVDGRVKQTTSAASRWNMRGISWENRLPGQKVATICGSVFTAIAVVFLIMVLFSDSLLSNYTLLSYILNGSWQPGLNLFAITRCIMVLLVAYAVVQIARRLLKWFAENMSAKGETICRLLDNVLKFAFWIAMLYFCMATLGADTSVLLTSAGILTLVVGLGANSLITDILAGLFIVFEGEFQVGDIVTIGGFRGTVQEIGVRTTKVKGGDNNVKVFANREVTGVLNMTKDYSSVVCSFTFPSAMSLERMELVLAKELPKVKKALPKIVEGPFYRGVTEMGDDVKLQIVAKCRESDRGQLERDLNREIRLIVEKHLLGPDAQANELERIAAERFNEEQSQASRDIHLDSDM